MSERPSEEEEGCRSGSGCRSEEEEEWPVRRGAGCSGTDCGRRGEAAEGWGRACFWAGGVEGGLESGDSSREKSRIRVEEEADGGDRYEEVKGGEEVREDEEEVLESAMLSSYSAGEMENLEAVQVSTKSTADSKRV